MRTTASGGGDGWLWLCRIDPFRVNFINMNLPRRYTMQARAESSAATRTRILDAATAAMRENFRPNVRLDEIAAAAGVSVQTVLRIFGSRALLLDAVMEAASADVAREFEDVILGDVDSVVRCYFNHYEKAGDLVIRNIVEEAEPELHAFVEGGRAAHRAGVAEVFAAQLVNQSSAQRRRTVDALVCCLDVYVWKLLRRDLGRSRRDAEQTVRQLVRGILEEGS